MIWRTSARFSKFVIRYGTPLYELRKTKGTGKSWILVPLFDLKFLFELAACGAATSNRRHWDPLVSSQRSSGPVGNAETSCGNVAANPRRFCAVGPWWLFSRAGII